MYRSKVFLSSANIPIDVQTKTGITKASLSFVIKHTDDKNSINKKPFFENNANLSIFLQQDLLNAFQEKRKVVLRERKYNLNQLPIRILKEVCVWELHGLHEQNKRD